MCVQRQGGVATLCARSDAIKLCTPLHRLVLCGIIAAGLSAYEYKDPNAVEETEEKVDYKAIAGVILSNLVYDGTVCKCHTPSFEVSASCRCMWLAYASSCLIAHFGLYKF